MKLKGDFILHETDGKTIMLNVDGKAYNGLIQLNGTAADMVRLLQKGTTKEDLIRDMLYLYDVSEEQLTIDADKLLSALKTIDVIDEDD